MIPRRVLTGALLLSALTAITLAAEEVIYQNDFSSSQRGGWSRSGGVNWVNGWCPPPASHDYGSSSGEVALWETSNGSERRLQSRHWNYGRPGWWKWSEKFGSNYPNTDAGTGVCGAPFYNATLMQIGPSTYSHSTVVYKSSWVGASDGGSYPTEWTWNEQRVTEDILRHASMNRPPGASNADYNAAQNRNVWNWVRYHWLMLGEYISDSYVNGDTNSAFAIDDWTYVCDNGVRILPAGEFQLESIGFDDPSGWTDLDPTGLYDGGAGDDCASLPAYVSPAGVADGEFYCMRSANNILTYNGTFDLSRGGVVYLDVINRGAGRGERLMFQYSNDGGSSWTTTRVFNGDERLAPIDSAPWSTSWETVNTRFSPADGNDAVSIRIVRSLSQQPQAGYADAGWAIDNFRVVTARPVGGSGGLMMGMGIDPNGYESGYGRLEVMQSEWNTLDDDTWDRTRLSIDMMVKLEAGVTEYTMITAMSNDATGLNYAMQLKYNEDSRLEFFIRRDAGSTAWHTYSTDNVLTVGEWHHIAAVYRGNETAIYVDSTDVTDSNLYGWSGAIADFQLDFADVSTWWFTVGSVIGPCYNCRPSETNIDSHPTGYGEYRGYMDEIRLWTVGLSGAEVANYDRRSVSYSNSDLLAYWDFNVPDGVNGVSPCWTIPNKAVITETDAETYWDLQRRGEVHFYSADPEAGIQPQVTGASADDLTFSVSASHPDPGAELLYTITQLPARVTTPAQDNYGVLRVTRLDGSELDVTEVPFAAVPSDVFSYAPPANETGEFKYAVEIKYQAAIRFTEIVSENFTLSVVIDPDFVAPPPFIVPPVPSPDVTTTAVDNTRDTTVILTMASVAGVMFFGIGSAVGRSKYKAYKADIYRQFWSTPKFTTNTAFSVPFRKNNAPTKQKKKWRELKSLLTDRKYQLVDAMIEVMDTEGADDVMRALVYINETQGQALDLLDHYFVKEVEEAKKLPREDAENMLFRGYSIAAKMWTGYVRMGFGLKYLQSTLAAPLYEICNRNQDRMEIDPDRKKKRSSDSDSDSDSDNEKKGATSDTKVNKYELLAAAQKVLTAIVGSVDDCPEHIRYVCYYVFTHVGEAMGAHKYRAVGGFLFLRLFCPAIAVPESYGLLEGDPADVARRLLVLVAKMLQNLAAGVEFGIKEEYMLTMNDFIRSNVRTLRTFVNRMATKPTAPIPPSALLPKGLYELAMVIVHKELASCQSECVAQLGSMGASGTARRFEGAMKSIGTPKKLKMVNPEKDVPEDSDSDSDY